MVDAELVKRKLERLAEDLENLRRSARYSLEEFLSEPERYGSAERFLQTAIETTIDLGTHIVSSEKLGQVATYRDVPSIFLEKSIISENISVKWISMIGFRNILVHEYGKIDRERVHSFLQEELDDLEAIKSIFLSYL